MSRKQEPGKLETQQTDVSWNLTTSESALLGDRANFFYFAQFAVLQTVIMDLTS